MPETSIANAMRRPRGARKSSAPEPAPAAAPMGDGLPDTRYLETLVGYNARRAALSVIAIFLRRMAPYDLRPVDFSVLTVIAHNPGVTSRQICAALDILPPNLVGMVKALIKRKLIVRKPHPSDGRAFGLHLSAAGAKLHREAQATASALEAEATAALSSDEVETLISLLRKVYRPGSAGAGNGDAGL
ncbi:MAG: MarR family transcriptional regulator [Hydrogenophaga sp.]|uniref:MarR family winged helix-turn-helix transcriptional regulator n=1 Tax=Hydrogenophaga sp. TaxID=1904254 RepID=UPI001E0B34A7|nr:MarR family transcriptional regulator [Hydrogenophaga sp.]MBX3611825.1 MarR family transcriptional regulator [Hydrogenophaga sp.]